jgi:S1-C subfamily serine protease
MVILLASTVFAWLLASTTLVDETPASSAPAVPSLKGSKVGGAVLARALPANGPAEVPADTGRLGAASSSEDARTVVSDLLGLELAVTESRIRRRIISTRTPYGFLISRVRSGSPAARAGLQKGDILLEWDGAPIREVEELAEAARLARSKDGSAPVQYARKRPNVPLTFPATDPWETRRTRIRLPPPPARRAGPI